MATVEQVRVRRREVLEELGNLEHIRRGSVTEQYVEDTHKDGTAIRRGPYMLYSYKEKNKTISRRLKSSGDADVYRKQIKGFRRFQEIMTELVSLGEQLCEAEGSAPTDLKKTANFRSRKRRR
jgi:hypothetical protein